MTRSRPSQETRLRELLEAAPVDRHHPAGPHRWVSVSAIMRLGIAQHSARITELRRHLREEGSRWVVENFERWDKAEMRRHSSYAMMSREESKAWRATRDFVKVKAKPAGIYSGHS